MISGATAFTRMPSSAYSITRDRMTASSPPLVSDASADGTPFTGSRTGEIRLPRLASAVRHLHLIYFPLASAHSRRVVRTLFWTTSGSFDRSRFAPSNQPVGSAKMMCCSTNTAPAGSASLVIFM